MKRVTVTELKNRLSEFLRLVKRGETIEVLERSIPIARISGVSRKGETGDEHLRRLVFEGIVTQAAREPDLSLLNAAPVECAGDAVRVLVEERDDR